ncbi:MAG: thymidine phosphorylase [Sandaracinaceae bacterium]|jgi:pyrimidine-nucleoside phosphorylase|nr:thymidine phosphorylase [Sandaracinaceae bacterium]
MKKRKTHGNARSIPELIVHKRSGGALSKEEIAGLIEGFTHGDVADYQMSALLMATFFQGMTPEETTALTLAMRDSGTVVDLSKVPGIKVDKHSTGGVGDKVSLCLAPLVAACGVPIPMVSGRGLGHTGGTLDKLEAIPGFNVSMPVAQFVKQVRDVGCALIGQTADIAPADKRIYALRDVTGTVESIPLITASILSKKLAEGIDALVLDVKVGRGAFMKTIEDARALARSIVRVGTLAKKRVTAILTSMEAPLGFAVGNALETAEAIEVLLGRGPDDLVECTLVLGAEMLRLGGVAKSESAARKMLSEAIRSRKGARVFENIIRAQKGDPRVVAEPDRLPRAPRVVGVKSTRSGFVTGIDALEIGLSAVAMGAGRTRADQAVDPAVGIMLHKKLGDKIAKGEVLAEVHVRDKAAADRVCDRIRDAYEVSPRAKKILPLVLDTIRK